MTDKNPFSGDGFSREPLSEDEVAQHREMKNKLEDAWPFIEGGADISKGASRLARVVGIAAAVGVVVSYMVKQGFFQ